MPRFHRHLVNNNHIRHSIRHNFLPRIYKDCTKKTKDKISFSCYIKDKNNINKNAK